MSKKKDKLIEGSDKLEELKESLESESMVDFREAVIKEVDSWKIWTPDNGKEIPHTDKIKPLVYGIGIDVVTRSRGLKRELFGQQDSYLNYTLEEAKGMFWRDLLVAVYIRSDYNSFRSAESLGYNSDEVFRCRAAQNSISLVGVKKHPEKFSHLSTDAEEAKMKIKDYTKGRILEYRDFLGQLVSGLIDKNADFMAERFVDVMFTVCEDFDIGQYTSLKSNQAINAFRSWYYTQQFIRAKGNVMKAAEYSGITQAGFRQFFSMSGLSTTEARTRYGLE